jgi:hypothetical protein
MEVSYTLNEMSYQRNDSTAKKSRGERGWSFHHGETSSHRFQDVGNRVIRALRPFRVIFVVSPIQCGSPHHGARSTIPQSAFLQVNTATKNQKPDADTIVE